MILFHDFAVADWKIFFGNLLMLVTCGFYIAWWVIAFGPGGTADSTKAAVCISVAVLAGIASIAVLSPGITSLAGSGKGIRLTFILAGAVVLYVILAAITTRAFHRPVTSELLVMVLWAAVELSAAAVLYRSGGFGLVRSALIAGLVVLATGIGVVCYVLYYRLDGASSFRDGLIPLAVDAGVVTVFLAMQAFSY